MFLFGNLVIYFIKVTSVFPVSKTRVSKLFAWRATPGEMNICEGHLFRPIKKYNNNSNNINDSNNNKCKKSI